MRIIKDRKIRLALVGCGRISKNHLDAIKNNSNDIELIALCDRNLERAKSAAEQFSASYYSELSELITKEKPDIISLATPNGIHAGQAIEIANAGIDVITEKPMALSWEDSNKMIEACKNNNARLFVIHQNRFNDTVQAVWQALQKGRFGKLYMITSNVFWQRPQEYYDKDASWHGTKEMDGGAFMTQASHYVDLVQWIAQSEPKSVYSRLATLARNIETEDTGAATIEWENGILGSINMTVLTYPRNFEGSVTVLGENGTVRIGGVAMNEIQHWEFSDKLPEDEGIKEKNYATNSVYGYGHSRYYENAVKVLRGNGTALIDGKEAQRSLKILCAIYDSHELNKPIIF